MTVLRPLTSDRFMLESVKMCSLSWNFSFWIYQTLNGGDRPGAPHRPGDPAEMLPVDVSLESYAPPLPSIISCVMFLHCCSRLELSSCLKHGCSGHLGYSCLVESELPTGTLWCLRVSHLDTVSSSVPQGLQ